MQILRDSLHFRILEQLCSMPRAVRGIAPAMLQRRFGDLVPVEELATAGFLRKRGWADGPGWVWVPTEAGEALYLALTEARPANSPVNSSDRVILPRDGAQRSS